MPKKASVPLAAAPSVAPPAKKGQFKYVVFDQNGGITQMNRVFDRKGYPDCLHDNAVSFLEVENLKGLDAETHHVEGTQVKERPQIYAVMTKRQIKANNVDAAIISPLPKTSKVTIFRNGIVMPGCADLPLNDTSMEVTATQPGRYRVEVDAWPYQRADFEIEAVE